MLKNITIIILSALFIFGCSSTEIVKQKKHKTDEINLTQDEKEEKALQYFIDGNIAEVKGDYATAINYFNSALRLNPNSAIDYSLAKNYLIIDKLSLALKHSKRSIAQSPDKIEYQSLLAQIYSSAHQYDSAAVVMENIIEQDSSQIETYYKLARIYENSHPLKAIKTYNKLTSIIGPEWSVLIRVAELYEKLGDVDNAIKEVENLLDIDPGNIALKKLLTELYERNKEYDRAVNILKDIIELTPDDLDARERLAKVYIEKDLWNKAADQYQYILNQPEIPLQVKLRIGENFFRQSFKDSTLLPIAKSFFEEMDKDTTDWQVKMFLGAIAINQNQDSVAINNFKKVTELASWNAEAWIRLGGIYFDNGRYEDAITLMNEAIESFPENFTINLILGLSYAQSDQQEKAKKYLEKSVKLNGGDVNALSAYAYTLNELGESEEAIKYLNRALVIDSDNVDLLGTLGLFYDGQENWAKTDSVYEAALKIDSTNALVNNNYAYSLSERDKRLNDALRMAKIAIEQEPESPSYLDTIGWVYFKLNDYNKAKDYIKKAIEIGGESSVMLEHLGDIYFKMNQKDIAHDYWQKALKIDNDNDSLKQKVEKGEI